MTKKNEWEKGLDLKITCEIKEAGKIMRKLEKTPDPILSKLLGFQIRKLTEELTVRKTSKHLSEDSYTFDVDEDGDYVFDFMPDSKETKKLGKQVHGYL